MNKNSLVIPEKLKDEWQRDNAVIRDFCGTEYYAMLMKAYRELRTDLLYESDFHGSDHIERVLIYGALISCGKKMNMQDADVLLRACAYHDIARISDWGDDMHGPRAAEMLDTERFAFVSEGLTPLQQAVVRASIAAHSRDDRYMDDYAAQFGITEDGDIKYYRYIASCVKDADNLDRFRVKDFNPDFLRNECSLELVPTARWIFDNFGRKPYCWW